MGSGGLARRLIDLATVVVGRLPERARTGQYHDLHVLRRHQWLGRGGGFERGGTLIPEMNHGSYEKDFNIAIGNRSDDRPAHSAPAMS